MIVKSKELVGLSSYSALQVFYKVMIGLKMYAAYAHLEPQEFFELIENMSEQEQDKVIREALLLVSLDKEELECLTSFCTDANGVPFRSENMKSLKPDQIFEISVKSCIELSKIKINFITENEKKN